MTKEYVRIKNELLGSMITNHFMKAPSNRACQVFHSAAESYFRQVIKCSCLIKLMEQVSGMYPCPKKYLYTAVPEFKYKHFMPVKEAKVNDLKHLLQFVPHEEILFYTSVINGNDVSNSAGNADSEVEDYE